NLHWQNQDASRIGLPAPEAHARAREPNPDAEGQGGDTPCEGPRSDPGQFHRRCLSRRGHRTLERALEGSQLVRDVEGSLETLARILFQTTLDDTRQVGRNVHS